MGFPRKEYQSGLSFPSPENLPDPGTELRSPALQADSLSSEPSGKQVNSSTYILLLCTTAVAWRVPWTEEPGMGSQGVGHD